MNAPIGTKDRPWRARISFRNGESTLALTLGMPVVLLSTDPSQVKTPVTIANDAQIHTLFAGLVCDVDVPAGYFGDVIVGGYHKAARILRMTKLASTDIWASFIALGVGEYFTIDSVNNALVVSGAATVDSGIPMMVAFGTLVSHTTRASDYFSSAVPLTATALTHAAAVWLHKLS